MKMKDYSTYTSRCAICNQSHVEFVTTFIANFEHPTFTLKLNLEGADICFKCLPKMFDTIVKGL